MAEKNKGSAGNGKLRSHLLRRRKIIIAKIDTSISHGSAIVSPDENDAASFAADGDLALRVATIESVELGEIDQALLRLEAGEYGICKECEEAIGTERLKALPHATLCIECKRLKEVEVF